MCEVTQNTLKFYEDTEFDQTFGLFRGLAVYGDGVAAYPDKFLTGNSGIVGCKKTMYSLSTNCMFYMAYKAAARLCKDSTYAIKADELKTAVNHHFWNADTGSYDYLAHECEYQEGLGISFALLSGIADEHAEHVIDNVRLTPNGIACVYPSFERYTKLGGTGRHSGTVWGFIQGFWGLALNKYGKYRQFDENLALMAEKACRDGQFAEIWHPETGEIYGGLQEDAPDGRIREWRSMRRQSWTASAFVALIVYGLFGCEWNDGRLRTSSRLPDGVEWMRLEGLRDRYGTHEIMM